MVVSRSQFQSVVKSDNDAHTLEMRDDFLNVPVDPTPRFERVRLLDRLETVVSEFDYLSHQPNPGVDLGLNCPHQCSIVAFVHAGQYVHGAIVKTGVPDFIVPCFIICATGTFPVGVCTTCCLASSHQW